MMARVAGEMAASSFEASIWKVSGSVSTKTGRANWRRTTFTVAMKVYGGMMTSSPGWTSSALSATNSAEVPLQVARQCRAPVAWAQACSNCRT